MPIRRLEKTYTGTSGTIGADELTSTALASVEHVKPHIQPGILCPAVKGKLLDGSTSHSGAYGTAQADGKSYYYTDIKGSGPIKDPRIGAHFGSQRHKFKSLQTLEQESGTHGQSVFSIDGRKWARAVGDAHETIFDTNGNYIRFDGNQTTHFYEFVCYCSSLNMILECAPSNRHAEVSIDGGSETSFDTAETVQNSPLKSRFVDAGTLFSVVTGQTLGIHTIKIRAEDGSDRVQIYGIEPVVQDATDANTKVKIQIPAQNVVTYGKKFALSATAHHYNPFATKGDGSASTIPNDTTGDRVDTGWVGSTDEHWESTLDTATSLGLGAWESGSKYYRPVNGGRVVKWVDSSGNIKTSVNMMPPTSICPTEISLGQGTMSQPSSILPTGTHNWSTAYQPIFGGGQTVGNQMLTGTWTMHGSHPYETVGTQSAGTTSTSSVLGNGTAWVNSSSYGILSHPITTVQGRYYKIEITNVNVSGNVALYAGPSAGSNAYGSWSLANSTYLVKATTSDFDTISVEAQTATSTITRADISIYEIEDPSSLSEIAKTFHWREFGNGAANTGGGGNYADASMLNTNDNIAYVMDDGLTSIALETGDTSTTHGLWVDADDDNGYLTFIGTGISWETGAHGKQTFAQNLPYGTHIFRVFTGNHGTSATFQIDGVTIKDDFTSGSNYVYNWAWKNDIHFHQPKMPPIPEDAVVLADYMLMADFTKETAAGNSNISKGTRLVSVSRDIFHDSGASYTIPLSTYAGWPMGFRVATQHANAVAKVPFFGTNSVESGYGGTGSLRFSSKFNGSASSNASQVNDPGTWGTSVTHDGATLGVNTAQVEDGINTLMDCQHFQLAIPTHTSSHYQSFETPYLHELVGGDRNMEQNNLVVTADGKTWDEVTRDTSYIGNASVGATGGPDNNNSTSAIVLTEWRGNDPPNSATKYLFNKDWAIAYDRMICLRDGYYMIHYNMKDIHQYETYYYRNSTNMGGISANSNSITHPPALYFERGDIFRLEGAWDGSDFYTYFQITRL